MDTNSEDMKYKVVKGKVSLDNGKTEDRWFVIKNGIPIFEINEWIEKKSIRKLSTGKKYAYSLVKFLNYLELRNKLYYTANKSDVEYFIDYLIFGVTPDLNYINIEGRVTYSTIRGYITTITEFYRWLEDNGLNSNMTFTKKKDYYNSSNSYLYGQIWGSNYNVIIDDRIGRLKPSKDYIKWYTDEETHALESNFLTLRDRVVFLLTMQGLRIDEVLSIRLMDYDRDELIVKPHRSKGKAIGQGRPIVLTEDLCEDIDNYIWNERAEAEVNSGQISDMLFINIKNSNTQGETLKYKNYIQILKSCAKRAGLDYKKIRTHSGRSSRTMELLRHQAKYPEDNLTDEMIRQIMGWNSPTSINPYKNHQDIELAKLASEKVQMRKMNKEDGDTEI